MVMNKHKLPLAVLVRILAETDSLWLPLRNYQAPRPANTSLGRQDYRQVGIPWHSEGAGSWPASKPNATSKS
jgi:hypothetical protein